MLDGVLVNVIGCLVADLLVWDGGWMGFVVPRETATNNVGLGAREQKWSKGKSREKKIHAVTVDQATFDKIAKDAPKKMKVMSVYSMVEQFKINAALARRILIELAKKNIVKPVVTSSAFVLYTKV